MNKLRNRWSYWTAPLPRDVDETFCLAVSAELSKEGIYSEYLNSLVSNYKIREVIDFSIPVRDCTVRDLRGASGIQALFKKDRSLDIGLNPLRAGVEAAIAAELQCGSVNRYFGMLCPYGGVVQAIGLARRKIKAVLGPVPALEKLRPRLGPGATTTVKRSEACIENKLGRPIVCSEDMLPKVHDFLAETPAWSGFINGHSLAIDRSGSEVNLEFECQTPIVVDTGKLLFVEKNAKTHRPICVEPVYNGFWQLGVGDYIKDRLCIHAHQDLRNQERNQLLAREGSVRGNVATLDLSSASDTIAFSVVFDLLPEDWVTLLSTLRTGVIEYDGLQFELEKFSSMGNGFTFELETLIFWALAWACTSLTGEDTEKVSVYGDDIIVPTRVVDLLMATLTWCGFNLNREKSYWDGGFRESCGADWLHGEDVRPVFKKDRLSYQWLFVFHNWCMRRCEPKLASIARGFIPEPWRLMGPDGYGDGHLLGSYELHLPRPYRRRGWGGGYFYTMRETPRSISVDESVAFLAGLYAEYMRPCSDEELSTRSFTPGRVPGSEMVERTSIYTFTENIFIR